MKLSTFIGCWNYDECYLIEENDGVKDLVGGSISLRPMCSKILVLRRRVVYPTYLASQPKHEYSYTTPDFNNTGILSLKGNRRRILKGLTKINLKSICGKAGFNILSSSLRIFRLNGPRYCNLQYNLSLGTV